MNEKNQEIKNERNQYSEKKYTEKHGDENRNYGNDIRRYDGNRNNFRGNKTSYRGNNHGGRYGYKGVRNNFQKGEFDIFESTKQFEKDKEMAKIEQQVKEMKVDEGNISPNEQEPEKAYDPNISLYDTLSCETFEKLNSKKINRREKNKLQEEQLRTDQETFGYNNTYDNRQRTNNYSNNYSNNYQSNYQNNYPKKEIS